MRLLDTYAVNCGAKIDKPFIYESYFPLPIQKYITIQAESPFDSKNYSYWQDVINMLFPFLLKENISIVQLGFDKEKAYQRVIDLRGKTNVNQLAYIIKHSMLHFGPDSFGIHLASHFDVPLVGLYGNSYKEVAGPHFGNPEKQILLDGYSKTKNGKPSFSAQEEPKSINSIKPEVIVNHILKLIGFTASLPLETVHTGVKYSAHIIRELIPNHPSFINNPEIPVEIRCDLFYEPKLLAHQLSYLQKGVIITDKPLDLNLLKQFKQNIGIMVYKVTENSTTKFVEDVIAAGFQALLVSELTGEALDKKKIDFYTIGKLNPIVKPSEELINKLKADVDKLYYRSNKIIASQGKVYSSHASIANGVETRTDMEYQKVIDSPNFWKDLDFFTIVKKLD